IPEGSTLLLLGDLLNLLDYTTMTGILTEVFSIEDVKTVADLRAQGRVKEARAMMHARSAGREEEIRMEIGRRVLEQYDAVFQALPDPTYLILGNVDNPAIAANFIEATPAVRHVDGEVITIDGERFGFVGGALPSPLNVPGEISEDEMARKVSSLGEVDVLCSHIPPAIPELCYDSLAGHAERGSEDILRYIEDVQPRRAYFGHVHQPMVSTIYVGNTLCVNVGYFRATKIPFPHSIDGR
ncbi:MAG TPA: metallophosphoesterase, partial [Actinomycetota bacterium]|nr:metallophosphoesterase [Actinomycetota bacterium]